MNHDAPRQKLDGTWGYTSANDNQVRPIGYCNPFFEFSESTKSCLFGTDDAGVARYKEYIAPYRAANEAGKFHDGGHQTAEEACACYKQYILDFDLKFHPEVKNPNTLHKCAVDGCGVMTSAAASLDSLHRYNLCPEHCNREEVAKLFNIGESWHS